MGKEITTKDIMSGELQIGGEKLSKQQVVEIISEMERRRCRKLFCMLAEMLSDKRYFPAFLTLSQSFNEFRDVPLTDNEERGQKLLEFLEGDHKETSADSIH